VNKSIFFISALFVLMLSALPGAQPALADVKLPSIESDFMVLQAAPDCKFFGSAAPGENVTVNYQNRKASATADKDGQWQTVLSGLKSGERFDIVVSGKNTVTIKNVLVGQVWLCSGQSNMEWPLAKARDHESELAAANHEEIRLFNVKRRVSTTPQADVEGAWCICNPQTAAPFSAVAYFFGRELHKDLKTPVGLIESSWGGTPAQSWTSLAGLQADPVTQKRYWIMAPEHLAHLHESSPRELEFPSAPSVLFNGMISGLLPATIGGVIWYQGESNAQGADETMAYRRLLPALIRDWRNKFQLPDLPFLFVQLANFDKKEDPNERSPWAELREAQMLSLAVPGTGMAVAIDIGEDRDIHPKNKQDVGKRLERIALARVYGKKVSFAGPLFSQMTVRGNKAICTFKFTDRGLKTRDGRKPVGFIICGEDKKFVPAQASIIGSTVVVSSPAVAKPVAVRYAWQGDPVTNLCNGAGFPASPFRTDIPPEPAIVNLPVTK